MFSLSQLNLNAGYWDIFWPQTHPGRGHGVSLYSADDDQHGAIRKEKMGNATSIYNLMRNIGGSFGIAAMTTFLARRQQVHQNQLISHVTPMDLRTSRMLHGLQGWFHQHAPMSATRRRT